MEWIEWEYVAKVIMHECYFITYLSKLLCLLQLWELW